MNVHKVGDGWFACDENLVKNDSRIKEYVCDCIDYKDFKTCKHVRTVFTLVFSDFEEKYKSGMYSEERYLAGKQKYDDFMKRVIPEPAFLTEIPKFQQSIRRTLAISRGHANQLWQQGVTDANQVIQHLFENS